MRTPTRIPPQTATAPALAAAADPAGDPGAASRPPDARGVRSYVVRAGRITPAQQRALEQLWPRYGVDFAGEPLDLPALFGRRAPCTLEIGFGNGDNLLTRAAAEPDRDFLGVEVHRPGVGHLLLGAAGAQLSNLRVIVHDAVPLVQQLPAGALEEVQVLFPDPWPKKRHHKRRLLQSSFIVLLARALRPAGRLHIVTDWQPYAEQIAADLAACELLLIATQLPQLAASSRLATRFERRGTRLGHGIHEFLYLRRP
ncbi:MAG TPA: tRNA (guanosine(46)-N7)-methyltransferase TrmB [Steroidobacteraceae bacterium]|nr:tRNA (guanosine(46)-N7)-methyltransferase TrmB [Steroidobacteraceae bacterium]